MRIESLTRVFNPKTSTMESTGSPSTSNEGFTASDMAAACCDCDDVGFLALKRRLTDDSTPCSGYYSLYARIVTLAQQKKWKYRNKAIGAGQIRKLLDICLDDYFNQFKCDKCHATGVIPIKEESPITTTCNKCHGAKLRARFDYERSKEIGVSKAAYSKYWRERHNQTMLMLTNIIPEKESEAEYRIKRLMK